MRLLLAALALAAACDAPKKASDKSEPAPAAKAPAAPPSAAAPAVEVTARQLFDDYARDIDAADAKYLGKPLLVHGLVHGHGRLLLELEGAGGSVGINAWFPDESVAVIHALKRYDEVYVRCTGSGKAAVPELKNCALETGRAAGLGSAPDR